jgi:CubicO group peptidase (beta-lactamase class C family)
MWMLECEVGDRQAHREARVSHGNRSTRIISEEGLTRASTPLASGTDTFMDLRMTFGVGFMLQTEDAPFGPAKTAFGHNGAGGSVHGAWPEEHVGFSYAMNDMRDDPAGDERVSALLDALHACVGSQGERQLPHAQT